MPENAVFACNMSTCYILSTLQVSIIENSLSFIHILLHFDICNWCLNFSENFMTICEIVNEMYKFENGKMHCNTNV